MEYFDKSPEDSPKLLILSPLWRRRCETVNLEASHLRLRVISLFAHLALRSVTHNRCTPDTVSAAGSIALVQFAVFLCSNTVSVSKWWWGESLGLGDRGESLFSEMKTVFSLICAWVTMTRCISNFLLWFLNFWRTLSKQQPLPHFTLDCDNGNSQESGKDRYEWQTRLLSNGKAEKDGRWGTAVKKQNKKIYTNKAWYEK